MGHELTTEERSRGGKRGAVTRVENQLMLRRKANAMWQVLDTVPADELPEYFTSGAVGLVELVRTGELAPPESATDVLKYVEAADKLHKMGRLAGGQSTSNSANLTANPDQLADLLDKVARLRGTTGSTVDTESQDVAVDEPDRQLPPAQ